MTDTVCSWTGAGCACTDFPWRVDGLIPRRCEVKISLDLIPLRPVRAPLKVLHAEYHLELKNETYDHTDQKWIVQ